MRWSRRLKRTFGNTYGFTDNNFTSDSVGTAYNSNAADDLVVPAGKTWVVKTLDVSGVSYNCTTGVNCGPANSEIVTFYKNKKGKPGARAKEPTPGR
jgi:hypothetical protein